MRATSAPGVEWGCRRRVESECRPRCNEQRAFDERRDSPDKSAYQIRRDFAEARSLPRFQKALARRQIPGRLSNEPARPRVSVVSCLQIRFDQALAGNFRTRSGKSLTQ